MRRKLTTERGVIAWIKCCGDVVQTEDRFNTTGDFDQSRSSGVDRRETWLEWIEKRKGGHRGFVFQDILWDKEEEKRNVGNIYWALSFAYTSAYIIYNSHNNSIR